MSKSKKKLAELHTLRAWCMTVVDYIIEVDESSAAILQQFKSIIEIGFDKKNLKGLKTLKSDLSGFVGDLNPSQRADLSKMLEGVVGAPLGDISKKAKEILELGYIENDDDYRFLNGYIDYLLEKDTLDDIDKIDAILMDYMTKER